MNDKGFRYPPTQDNLRAALRDYQNAIDGAQRKQRGTALMIAVGVIMFIVGIILHLYWQP
jgi:hypothetical protein